MIHLASSEKSVVASSFAVGVEALSLPEEKPTLSTTCSTLPGDGLWFLELGQVRSRNILSEVEGRTAAWGLWIGPQKLEIIFFVNTYHYSLAQPVTIFRNLPKIIVWQFLTVLLSITILYLHCSQLQQPSRVFFYLRDTVSSVIATATWLAGWVAGYLS